MLFSFDLPERLRGPDKIAARLGLPEKEIERIVGDLLRRGLLAKKEDGVIFRPTDSLETSDGIPSGVIRGHHRENLRLAEKALSQLPVERRDFTSLTFVGRESQIAELRREIRALHEKAPFLLADGGEGDQVFRLSVQLFPVELNQDE